MFSKWFSLGLPVKLWLEAETIPPLSAASSRPWSGLNCCLQLLTPPFYLHVHKDLLFSHYTLNRHTNQPLRKEWKRQRERPLSIQPPSSAKKFLIPSAMVGGFRSLLQKLRRPTKYQMIWVNSMLDIRARCVCVCVCVCAILQEKGCLSPASWSRLTQYVEPHWPSYLW